MRRGVLDSEAFNEEQLVEDIMVETAASSPAVLRQGPFSRGPNIDTEPTASDPFITDNKSSALSDHRVTFRRGADFDRLLSSRADRVIEALGEKLVKSIGRISCTDAEIKTAFGHDDMVTRGSRTVLDMNFNESWEPILNKQPGLLSRNEYHRWSEPAILAIYAVDIENAAAPLEHGILTPLLRKVDDGPNSVDIWDLPAVRAVIEYKWESWAKKYLLIEFALYMAWLISFVGFLMLYIQRNLNHGFDKGNGGDKTLWLTAIVLDLCSVGFMLPFIIIDFNSVKTNKWQWLQMWNIIDFVAYILQIIITEDHLSGFIMNSDAYKTLLAIQCLILFVKVQYFFRLVYNTLKIELIVRGIVVFRVVSVGASYVETLRAVLYDVRYFLIFIIASMVSATLSFAVLYSDHSESDYPNSNIQSSNNPMSNSLSDNITLINSSGKTNDFSSVPKALVTTYAVLLGSFDSDYVFNTNNSVIKGIFFLFFQVCMSIMVLNLLIAVVTDSYAKVMKKKRALYNKGRAQLIDELEVALPKSFIKDFDPYIHFGVIVKKETKDYELSALKTLPPLAQSYSANDVHSKLNVLENIIREMDSKMDTIQRQLNQSTNGQTSNEEYLGEIESQN
eukprot:g4818.t1